MKKAVTRRSSRNRKEQEDMRLAAEKCLGSLASSNPHRAETAREAIRHRLRQRQLASSQQKLHN